MKTRTAVLVVAGLYACGLLATFGPPAVHAYVTSLIFGF